MCDDPERSGHAVAVPHCRLAVEADWSDVRQEHRCRFADGVELTVERQVLRYRFAAESRVELPDGERVLHYRFAAESPVELPDGERVLRFRFAVDCSDVQQVHHCQSAVEH